MTRFTKRAIIVITAAGRDAANAALERRGYGPNTFSAPRVPVTRGNGAPPATHYVCDWAMTPAQRTEVESVLTAAGVNVTYHDRDVPDPAVGRPRMSEVDTARGIKPVQTE